MYKSVVGLLLCGGLFACSSSGASKPAASGGAGVGGTTSNGGSAAGGAGGQAGSGGSAAGGAGGRAGSGGSVAGGAGGQGGTGGLPTGGSTGDWPTYEQAVAAPRSTRVLVLLLDFADSDQNQLLPDAEARWGQMIFGREQSNGNHYWYQASAGQFQLLPAAETQLTPNNGVVHIKVTENKPTSGVLIAEKQPWLTEAIDLAAQYVDYKSFDKNGDGHLTNDELSVLVIINWEFDQIANAPAQANIALNHPIPGTGVTLDKFARDMYLHTSIGISMHELGHHVLGLDHTPSPTDHDLMGYGEYWPDPVIRCMHDPNDSNATRPTHPKAIHKVRAGFVQPTEVSASMQGVKLYAPEFGKQYNVLKLPVVQGFLLIDNRHAWGYDQSIPYCQKEAGAIFVDDVGQYLDPLDLVNGPALAASADFSEATKKLCDVYALAGHNAEFSFGGWKITNVSAPGPVMTLDIEKLTVTPAIDHYKLRTFRDESGSRVGHQTRLDGGASTLDFSQLYGGDTLTGYVSFGLNAYYNTGEVRNVVLDTTFTSDSPYIDVNMGSKFTNGGAPTPDTITTFVLHPDATHVTSAKITIKRDSFVHVLTLTNLPQQ